MPSQVLFAVTFEIVLILLTSLLVVQPEMIFKNRSVRVRGWMKGAGFLLLCVTFCWSIVVGALMTLNGMNLDF